MCKVIMAASGNYKRVPEEDTFIPAAVRRPQSQEAMFAEIAKLKALRDDG
jgi:hypothetical protein